MTRRRESVLVKRHATVAKAVKRMTMTNAEHADALSCQFGLTGVDAVTVNVIRQWVLWDVLSRASAAGRAIGQRPDWSRDARSHQRARRLAELRRDGVRRKNAVIAQAYLEWRYTDIGQAQAALASEFKRGRARMLKRFTSAKDLSDFDALSSVTKRAVHNQMGALSPTFVGTQFELSDRVYASILDLMRGGKPNAVQAIVAEVLRQILPSHANSILPQFIEFAIDAAIGILGIPDEMSGSAQSTLESASHRDLRVARYVNWRFLKFLHSTPQLAEWSELNIDARDLFAALAKLRPQISVGHWAVFSFAVILHALRKSLLAKNRN